MDNSDDSEDDWFYESIRRYNILQMFDLQNTPEHVIQLDQDSVGISCKYDKRNSSELMKLKLPKKLTLSQEDEGRSKGNDFKVVSGVFSSSPVIQMDFIRQHQKILTSELNTKGLHMYNWNSDDEENTSTPHPIQLDSAFSISESPSFAVHQETLSFITYKTNQDEIVHGCLGMQESASKVTNPFKLDTEARLDCTFLNNPSLVAMLNTCTGSTLTYDLRMQKVVFQLVAPQDTPTFWTMARPDYMTLTDYIGIVSNAGQCFIFDQRNSSNKLQYLNTNCTVPYTTSTNIHMRMSTQNRFSLSGFDSNVYIFDFKMDDIENVFVHDGHIKLSTGSTSNYVVDHIWLPNISQNVVLSICDNMTLNCWQYNV